MNKQIFKIAGVLVALALMLGIGAVVGGGIVYAMRADGNAIPFPFSSDGEALPGSEPGMVIAKVMPDGPAAQAGVERGDILLMIDDEAVNHGADLRHVLGEHTEGDAVTLTVLHGDDERALTVTLGGHNDAAYLGVVPCAGMPTPEQGMMIQSAPSGAMIVAVTPDGPADRAGLAEGDVIIAVDEQPLDPEHNLADVIAAYEPGDTVTLTLETPDEDPREVTVELDAHPDKDGVAYLGVKYQPSWSHREWMGEIPSLPWRDGIPGDIRLQGAVVRDVAADSPAEAAGVQQGDLITAIDGDPVTGPEDLVDAVAEHEPGDTITLTLSANGEEERDIEVTLAKHPDEEGQAYLGVRLGGLIHLQRLGKGDHEQERFELPFDFEDKLHRFEFHFPPAHLDDRGTDCCGESI